MKLDKNGLLKEEKRCFALNLSGLVLDLLSLGGILTAIGLDKVNPEAAITTTAVSLGVGAVGVALSIATEIKDKKLEKIKAQSADEDNTLNEDEDLEICGE